MEQPVGSTSESAISASSEQTGVKVAGSEKAIATVQLYNYFQKGGLAYTFQDKRVNRYYCNACVRSEVQKIRAAREQYGQGADVSDDVLRGIARSRLEYYIPNPRILQDHLKQHCQCISSEERADIIAISKTLADAKAKSYSNPYDYGSVYEVTHAPKLPGKNQDITPGAASPARIYAAHEASLLKRLHGLLKQSEAQERHQKRKRTSNQPVEAEPEAIEEEEHAYNSEDFEQGQATRGNLPAVQNVKVDENIMYSPDDNEDEVVTPADFPTSDLLKALQTYAGRLFSERGLMSTERRPTDGAGNRIPSMVQSMDASALIALGVMTQELAKHHVLRPHIPQPLGDFCERTVESESLEDAYGLRTLQETDVVTRVLRNLPEGSTVGLRGDPTLEALEAE